MILDRTASRVTIHTYAEGLFSRLAHDLEIACTDLRGELHDDVATIDAPLAGFEVRGVIAKGRLDESVLSASDKRDILAKMRREVFPGGDLVRVEVTRERVRVRAPSGDTFECSTPKFEESSERIASRGAFDVSMTALGAKVVKGPMGAFRVKDRVTVHFDIVFQPA